MARYKGVFTVAANYEPLVGGPFDARELVEYKADLINPRTWLQSNGEEWTYVGMIVTVSADIDKNNNGIYQLIDKDFTKESNWLKLATQKEIFALEEKIDQIEISGGSVDLSAYAKSEDIAATYSTIAQLNLEIARAKAAEEASLQAIDALLKGPVKQNTESITSLSQILLGIGGENEPMSVVEAIAIAKQEAIEEALELAPSVSLEVATEETLGGIKLSEEVGINEEDQLEVKTLSTDKLVQGEQELLFSCGNAD